MPEPEAGWEPASRETLVFKTSVYRLATSVLLEVAIGWIRSIILSFDKGLASVELRGQLAFRHPCVATVGVSRTVLLEYSQLGAKPQKI